MASKNNIWHSTQAFPGRLLQHTLQGGGWEINNQGNSISGNMGALDVASGSQKWLFQDVRTPFPQHEARCCWTGSCHAKDMWSGNYCRWLLIRSCKLIAPHSCRVEGERRPVTVEDRLGGINHLCRVLLKLPGECSIPAQAWHATNTGINTYAPTMHSREAEVAFTASGNLLNN